MTNQEWKRRCAEGILRRVTAAGINGVNLRRLRRAMSYHRAPRDTNDYSAWDLAFDELRARKQIVIEWSGTEDNPNASGLVLTPALKAARDICRGVSSDNRPGN
jgi:hypothetical protein